MHLFDYEVKEKKPEILKLVGKPYKFLPSLVCNVFELRNNLENCALISFDIFRIDHDASIINVVPHLAKLVDQCDFGTAEFMVEFCQVADEKLVAGSFPTVATHDCSDEFFDDFVVFLDEQGSHVWQQRHLGAPFMKLAHLEQGISFLVVRMDFGYFIRCLIPWKHFQTTFKYPYTTMPFARLLSSSGLIVLRSGSNNRLILRFNAFSNFFKSSFILLLWTNKSISLSSVSSPREALPKSTMPDGYDAFSTTPRTPV